MDGLFAEPVSPNLRGGKNLWPVNGLSSEQSYYFFFFGAAFFFAGAFFFALPFAAAIGTSL